MALLSRPHFHVNRNSFHIDQSRLFANFMNNLHSRQICRCGAKPIEDEKVRECFQNRKVRELKTAIDCAYFNKFQFKDPKNCNLYDQVFEIYRASLNLYSDVIRINPPSARIYFEALVEIPPEQLGDLTGDHGKHVSLFLEKCIQENIVDSSVQMIFDIGGQNNSTSQLISSLFKPLPLCFIIDVNPLTPALAPEQPNIKYVVDDALSFFNPQNFEVLKEDYELQTKKNLFIFNNFLNLQLPEEGWKCLIACWQDMNAGDYIMISSLRTEHFQYSNYLTQDTEVDGIISFFLKSDSSFFKSTLSNKFAAYALNKLEGSQLTKEEEFNFNITIRNQTAEIKSRHILLQKVS